MPILAVDVEAASQSKMTKPVLMIHEVREEFFELPLEDYVLTFDDGLYSQFHYIDRFLKIDTPKIFFISSDILCQGIQSRDLISCEDAHEKAFAGNKENYMTLDQVKNLASQPQVSIGGHSHSHRRLTQFKILEKLNHIQHDTSEMIMWFENHLGFRPTKFCFPYNDNYDGLYNAALKQYGITECYGRERIPVEQLLRSLYQSETLAV